MDMTADMTESINTRQNTMQMQNLPIGVGRCNQVKLRNHAGMPNMHTGMHGIADHTNTAGDT